MAWILPISGKAQHGKDTTANVLKQRLEKVGYKVLIVHFGDYLKFICKEYFGWDGVKDEKGRQTLQYIGTDKARRNNPDIWVNVIIELIAAISDDYDFIIIPDARFPNEIIELKDWLSSEVLSIRVNRLNFESTLTDLQKQHASEIALDDYEFEVYINCETGIENIEMAVDKFIKEVLYNWMY